MYQFVYWAAAALHTHGRVVAIYAAIVNFMAFMLYAWYKRQAIHGARRVRESTLLWIAALGGAVGAFAAMHIFRHKTRHKKFVWGVPLLLLLHALLVVLFVYAWLIMFVYI